MMKITKKEILYDFEQILNQIENKPAEEIELGLQCIIRKMRPLIHHV